MTRIDLARASDLGSGIPAGTSFPSTPANNDLFYRTDLDALFYYDSTLTKWLTVQDFIGPPTAVGGLPYTGTTIVGYFAPDDIGTYTDLYLKYVVVRTQATVLQDASNYWDIQAFKDPQSGAGTSLASNNTQGDAANEWFSNLITINALMGSFTSWKMLRLVAAKTGASGNLYVDAHWVYKRVI